MLPVTPSGYEWASRASIETVAVDQLGDLNLFGGTRMAQTTLRDCLLPAQEYPFLSPGEAADPWRYVQRLEQWISSGTPVRFIVSGTPVNAEVLIEELTYREQDGTNDLYADITIRQYRRPETPRLSPAASASTALTRDNATGAARQRRTPSCAGIRCGASAGGFTATGRWPGGWRILTRLKTPISSTPGRY